MPQRENTDAAIVADIGGRVAKHRAARNLTQGEFADKAGVGRSTIQRIERGDSIQLASFVKILRVLDRLDALDALLSPDIRSPLAELERLRKSRQRVRGKGREGAPTEPRAAYWTWDDEHSA